MNEEETRQVIGRVLRRIAPEADLDSLPPGADMRRELDLDSMDFLELVAGLGKATGVDIPERDYPKIATLESCMRYLVTRTGRAAVSG